MKLKPNPINAIANVLIKSTTAASLPTRADRQTDRQTDSKN
jgi:hypothetical protein